MFSTQSEDVLASTTRPLLPEVDGPWSPKAEVAPNCPRCDSANTKFCYYNNYSLSQPRYLCKACRRYWTKGGSLRNVPVGGGCRRKRGGKSTTSTRVAVGSRGAEFFERRPDPRQGPTRPDVRLSDVATASSSATNGTSAIDLEELYAKYTNQGCTDSGDFAVMPPLPDAESEKDDAGFIRTSSESCSFDFQMNYNAVPLQLPNHQQIEEYSDEYYYNIATADSANLCVDWVTMPTSKEPAAGSCTHDQMILDLPYDPAFDSVSGMCHQKNLTTDIEFCGSCSFDYNYSSLDGFYGSC